MGEISWKVVPRLRYAMLGATITVVGLALLAPLASASGLIGRNTTHQRLLVNKKGTALVTFKSRGKTRKVALWGAKNTRQLFFRHDYSGGVKSGKVNPNTRFRNVCRRYKGPKLQYAVASCTMPDGSHWALQQWVRMKKNGGGKSGVKELRASHWTGATSELTVTPDWSWRGRYNHIYGTLRFHGKPWFAETWDEKGSVHDGIGRNFAIESYNSDMGKGWRRVNMFLTHKPRGQYCFGFTPKSIYKGRGDSAVNKYRALVPGPAVTPDVFVAFQVLGVENYTYELDEPHNIAQRALIAGYSGGTNCKNIN